MASSFHSMASGAFKMFVAAAATVVTVIVGWIVLWKTIGSGQQSTVTAGNSRLYSFKVSAVVQVILTLR
jgi:hypothetical protein